MNISQTATFDRIRREGLKKKQEIFGRAAFTDAVFAQVTHFMGRDGS